MMSVIVLMDMQTFKANLRPFLREMGLQLRTNVRIRQDDLKNDMIYAWKLDGATGGFFTKYPRGSSGVIVYLEIDNRKCMNDEKECFSTANEVGVICDTASKLHFFKTQDFLNLSFYQKKFRTLLIFLQLFKFLIILNIFFFFLKRN